MSREERVSQAAMTGEPAAGTSGPRWRALLEARWQARVREVTELSLAYHVAAAAAPGGIGDGDAQPDVTGPARPHGRGPQEAGGRRGCPRPAGGGQLRVLRAVRIYHPGRAARHRARDQVLPALRRGTGPGPGRGGTSRAMTLPVWAGTFAVFAVLMAADLALTRKAVGLRAAATSSVLWIAAALAFGGALWLWRGPATAGQYFAGYLLEKALSVDNVFVFVMLFASLQVPAALQRRVLHFGVVGALVMRGGFIAAGGALIEHIGWIFYVFGALVMLAGVRMFRSGAADGPGRNLAVRGLRRVLPVTDDYAGHRFFVRLGRQDHGHAPARGPGGHRGHRPGVRARLHPGGLRRHQGPVRGVHVQRLRRPRPAGALLPAGRLGGPVRLPQAGNRPPAGVHRHRRCSSHPSSTCRSG